MSVELTQQVGMYVYAIVRTAELASLSDSQHRGIDGESLQFITVDELTVVASGTTKEKIRPQRRYLAAHQAIVTWIASETSMLPVAFGLIAESEESVRRMIQTHSTTLSEQLERVAGRVEMNLNLRYSVDNVFQFLVRENEELQQASQYIASGAASRDEQIELGRRVEAVMLDEKAKHLEQVLEQFKGLTVETDEQSLRDDAEIFRVAFLIDRENVDRFNETVYRAAEAFDENFAFSFNGPWPPYSFVSLSIHFE